MTATITNAPPRAAAAAHTRFYFWMAVAMAATAFLGFLPTFWAPLAQGVPERIGVLAIHSALFFAWPLFLIYQTQLVASGNTARHRDTGMIGVSLATAMVILGLLAAINAAQRAIAMGSAEAGEAFMIVPLTSLFSFAVLVTVAIANVRRPEWHKRLMLSATSVILDAAIARPFMLMVVFGGHIPPFQGTVGLAGFNAPPPPIAGLLPPTLIGLLFIVAGMVFDWRKLGKVHPAYWCAGGFVLALQLLKIPFSDTALWHATARFLVSLAG